MAPLTQSKGADQALEEKLGQGAFYEAKQAAEDEHSATIGRSLRENWKAVAWSVAISAAIIMEGYDTILMGNLIAMDAFKEAYGTWHPELNEGEGAWEVDASWQSALNMSSTVGCIFGGLLNGYFITKYGYRWVLIISMLLLNGFIFIMFFAPSRGVLVFGNVMCGLCWGVFATLCSAYASEVAPLALRPYMTTWINACWAIGQLLAAGVLTGCLEIEGSMAYRVPFAIQWLWPTPLMVVAFFAPESPYLLVRQERLEEAKHSIKRLSGSDKTEEQINNQLAMMVHTTKVEAAATTGGTYSDCFRGTNLRRTEIVCVCFMGQILSGSSFSYTPTYFFTAAGMAEEHAFDLSLGAKGMGLLGTLLSWFLVTWLGRRTIYVWGIGSLSVLLYIIGILQVSAGSQDSTIWAQGSLCIIWLFTYSLTLGPITYSIISEMSSTRLRPQSVVLARTAYQIINVVSQVLNSYQMNPTAWNWSGKTGFFWGTTAALVWLYSYFRLPEIRGRTYEELDILFFNKTPAREFSSATVDAYVVGGGTTESTTAINTTTTAEEKS